MTKTASAVRWCFLALSVGLAPRAADAGYIETLGFDARSAAMGGAFTAVADTATAWYYNPAGLAQIDHDVQEVGLSQAVLVFGEQGDGTTTSDDETPPIYNVHFPSVLQSGIDGLVLALGGGVTWGQALEWSQTEGDLRFSGYESSVFVNTLSPALGYRIGRTGFMIGATVNVSALRQLESRQKLGDGFFTDAAVDRLGIDLPFVRDLLDTRNGVDDGKLEIQTDEELPTGLRPTNDVDIDFEHFGFNVGVLWSGETSPFSFGLTYRSEMPVTFEGSARLEFADDVERLINDNRLLVGLNGGPLTAERSRFEYEIEFPRQIAWGIAYRASERLLFSVDGVWTDWPSSWTKQALRFSGDGLLGVKRQEFRRDFNDTVALRVGWEYRVTADFRAQAGFWWDPTPVPKTTIDSGTLDATKLVYSLGLAARDFLYRAFDAPAFEGVDIGAVVQVLHVPERVIDPGQSVNLGGTKRFDSTVNDFRLEFSGLALSLGATLGYRF